MDLSTRPAAPTRPAPAARLGLTALLLLGLGACTGSSDNKASEAEAGEDSGEAGADTGGTDDCPEASLFPTLVAHPDNAAYPDPSLTAACVDDTLVVSSNAIPTYPYVDMTPNGLEAQDFTWTISRSPEVATTPTDIPLLGVAGFTLNGIPIYGPNEGDFPDPYGDPVYNMVVDTCYGHTGFAADYHYHALLVACILSELSVAETEPDPIIGFAMDGFPIYGPRGCLDADCAEVVTFESGWVQTGDPTTYAWDNHAYAGDSGDPTVLDQCNGRIGPDGTYRYHATATFPYILGCYAGTASASSGGGAPDGGTDGGTDGGADGGADGGPGADPVDCADVPDGMPCCGDGVCDGPETADNCAVDCG